MRATHTHTVTQYSRFRPDLQAESACRLTKICPTDGQRQSRQPLLAKAAGTALSPLREGMTVTLAQAKLESGTGNSGLF